MYATYEVSSLKAQRERAASPGAAVDQERNVKK
jgi:hypothetical protein